ncbi:MAG: sugar kinase [Desulfovibrionaceae bacterium]|nr:sugar kinase [Desulfovibrionaceae bacterium]
MKRAGPERAWLICGTVPDEEFPLRLDRWGLEGQSLVSVDGMRLPVRRGTTALLAAALTACAALGVPAPEALLVGDAGSGGGSARLYRHLAGKLLPVLPRGGITFHYMFPDLDGHNRVLMALDALPAERRPLLVADAGYMYVAKMSGYASSYDLFTPDAGELAFLADEKAPHPFYTRGFLLAGDNNVPELAARAAAAGNSARHLLIKGAADFIIRDGEVLASVDAPLVPVLEPMGGTGDVVTGLVTALLAAGCDMISACLAAAHIARAAGAAARPDPSSSVVDLLPFLPGVVRAMLPAQGTDT